MKLETWNTIVYLLGLFVTGLILIPPIAWLLSLLIPQNVAWVIGAVIWWYAWTSFWQATGEKVSTAMWAHYQMEGAVHGEDRQA